jgi:hypothetical protein
MPNQITKSKSLSDAEENMEKTALLKQIKSAKGLNDFFECCKISYPFLENQSPETRPLEFAWFLRIAKDSFFSKRDKVPLSKEFSAQMNEHTLRYRRIVKGLIDNLSPNGYPEEIYYQKLWDCIHVLLSEATEEEKGYCIWQIALDERTPYYALPQGLKLSEKQFSDIYDTIMPTLLQARFAFAIGGTQKSETSSRIIHLLEKLNDLDQKSVFMVYLANHYEDTALKRSEQSSESKQQPSETHHETKNTEFSLKEQNESDETNSAETLEHYPFPHLNGGEYDFVLKRRGDDVFLSDQGKTLVQLDLIFELNEPDVVKNLIAIMNQFEVIKQGNEFIISIKDWSGLSDMNSDEGLKNSLFSLFSCVSFMLNMKIFYE